MAKVHNGVCVYTINSPNNLHGTYANERGSDAGVPFTEMAVRTTIPSADPIEGTYNCSWYESGTQINGVLNITKRNPQNVYDLIWTIAGQPTPAYLGVGYILNSQLAVHYKSV